VGKGVWVGVEVKLGVLVTEAASVAESNENGCRPTPNNDAPHDPISHNINSEKIIRGMEFFMSCKPLVQV
jgi:hypothetical protein